MDMGKYGYENGSAVRLSRGEFSSVQVWIGSNGVAGRVAIRFGGAVRVRRGMVRFCLVRQFRLGEFSSGEVCSGTAVMVRYCVLRLVEYRHGSYGLFLRGLVRYGMVRSGSYGKKSIKIWNRRCTPRGSCILVYKG